MDNYTLAQRSSADAFQKGMAAYQAEPILLYGFGRNTEGIIKLTDGYTIVGILGPTKTSGELYGKRILSLEEAAQMSSRIVIVASESSKRIIFRCIHKFAEAHNMVIHDITGKELQETSDSYDQSSLDEWNHSWDDLQKAIAEHDVISFDIFDTLLARYVLRPRDVFALIEWETEEALKRHIPFETIRTEAERSCAYGATIDDIYEKICQEGISREQCQRWREQELTLERKLTFPRKRIVKALQYAHALNKQIILTSDMYLPKRDMEPLLASHGIKGYDTLLISCEEKAQKSDGTLYIRLKQLSKGSILHIGDNQASDVQAARSMGIDSWHVWSGYDLFMVSSLSELLVERMSALGDRLALGLVCAKLFDDPFALHETKGRVTVSTPEQMGYSFIGPWALGFMQWAARQIDELGIEQFIYPSRDGFLFYQIGQIMQKHGYMANVDQVYIKASRRALSVASIQSEDDLPLALSTQRYRGTNGEMLKNRFGVKPKAFNPAHANEAGSVEESIAYLKNYMPEIFKEASFERKNYQAYLKHHNIINDKKAAIFDFVARGTVQYYLEKQINKQLIGLYCATIDHPNQMFPENKHVYAAFGNGELYSKYSSGGLMLQVMEMMETILVDGENTLKFIDTDGNPVLDTYESSYECAMAVQKSACTFIQKYLSLFPRSQMTVTGAEKMLGAMFHCTCTVTNPVLDMFSNYDEGIPGENIFSVID